MTTNWKENATDYDILKWAETYDLHKFPPVIDKLLLDNIQLDIIKLCLPSEVIVHD